MKKLSEYANEIGKLVEEKDIAYGNSFDKSEEFLKLLYPNGITLDKYADMLCLIRMFDKQMRIATNKGAFNENTYQDLAGYSLLGWRMSDNKKENEEISTLNKIKAMEDQGKDL